jgi:hypothetical protein
MIYRAHSRSGARSATVVHTLTDDSARRCLRAILPTHVFPRFAAHRVCGKGCAPQIVSDEEIRDSRIQGALRGGGKRVGDTNGAGTCDRRFASCFG